jgi:hypothetical protein
MTLDDTLLADRIGEAIGSQQAIAGWSDVKARAQRPDRSRGVPRLGRTLLIAAAFVLVGGSIAFAFGDRIGEALGLYRPPLTIEQQMAGSGGASPGSAPQLLSVAAPGKFIAGSSRLLIRLPTRHFGVVRLYSGRTTRGYCELIVRDGKAARECRSNLIRTSSPVVYGFSGTRSMPGATLVDGHAYSANARSLRIRFRRGGSRTVALVDRFFLFELEPDHARTSDDPPIAFDVLDASGRTIGTRTNPYSFAPPRPIAVSVHRIVRVRLANAQGSVTLSSGRDAGGHDCVRVIANRASFPAVGWECGPGVLHFGRLGDDRNPTATRRVPVSWALGAASVNAMRKTFAYGWVGPSVRRLRLRFQDGARVDIPLHGGYFVYPIPVANWRAGHRPSVLDVFNSDARPIYHQFLYPRQPCVYPGPDSLCSNGTGHGFTSLPPAQSGAGTIDQSDNGGFAGTTSTP